MGEFESLGLSTIRLNELNDNDELHGLVRRIKDRGNDNLEPKIVRHISEIIA